MSTPARDRPTQTVSFACDQCARRLRVTLAHYDLGACPGCGKTYWALQPKRQGPFIMFPHPGFFRLKP
jgi:hypothetical protein